jgi:hypothetical protein
VSPLTRPRAAAATALVLAGAASAAPLLPPSLSIRLPQNAVAVVTVLEVVDAERVRFRRDTVLQEDKALEETGEAPPQEIVVRVPEEVAARVEVGRQYVIGYSSLLKVAEGKDTFSPDPEGPRLVDLPAVGPALLESSPAMVKLATPRPSDAELEPRERLDLILAQLERPDPTGRLFVMAEMVLWTELREPLTEADVDRFRAILESGALEARAREYYLRAFVPIRDQVGQEWLAEECRRVLAENEAELDLLSPYPSLVRLALSSLREMGGPEDGEAALEFLHSNNDAVSLAAFRTAAELAPERTEEVVEKIVLVGNLPLDTEREVIRFLAERQTERRESGGPG